MCVCDCMIVYEIMLECERVSERRKVFENVFTCVRVCRCVRMYVVVCESLGK